MLKHLLYGLEYSMHAISKSNWFRRGRFVTYNKKNSTVKVKNWKMTTEYQLVKYNRMQKKIKQKRNKILG